MKNYSLGIGHERKSISIDNWVKRLRKKVEKSCGKATISGWRLRILRPFWSKIYRLLVLTKISSLWNVFVLFLQLFFCFCKYNLIWTAKEKGTTSKQLKYEYFKFTRKQTLGLSGLGVWFSLWVREVPGSNPGWAQFFGSFKRYVNSFWTFSHVFIISRVMNF